MAPAVATGIKNGVGTAPCAVISVPALPDLPLVFSVNTDALCLEILKIGRRFIVLAQQLFLSSIDLLSMG
jgi:hypothetical protein